MREYEDLKQLADEMGLDEAPRPARRRSAPTPRPRGGTTRSTTAPRRRSSGGQIGARMLDAVRGDPGKTVAEYAEALKVPATSLYRPVRELTMAGTLVKRGRQLYPA